MCLDLVVVEYRITTETVTSSILTPFIIKTSENFIEYYLLFLSVASQSSEANSCMSDMKFQPSCTKIPTWEKNRVSLSVVVVFPKFLPKISSTTLVPASTTKSKVNSRTIRCAFIVRVSMQNYQFD